MKRFNKILVAALATFGLLGSLYVKDNPFTVSSAGDSGYQDITGYTVGTGVKSVVTSSDYPFTYSSVGNALTSGNKGVNSSISELKITVVGNGALIFSYNCLNVSEVSDGDYFVVNINNPISSLTRIANAHFYTRKVAEYTSYNVTVTGKEDNEETIIYVGYKKNGNGHYGEDIVNVQGISFFNSETKATIDVSSSNTNYGTVTGGGEYYINQEVTITATPTANGKFYCWQLFGQKTDYPQTHTFNVYNSISLVAIFGPNDTDEIQNITTGMVYTDLASALDAATSGQVIMPLSDTTLSTTTAVKSGVTLYIPFSDSYVKDGFIDGDTSCTSTSFAPASKVYRTLTIANTGVLNVQGTLLIGGVIGYPSQNYQGHTSGAFGQIINNGTINVVNGTLNCYGFINGTGTVDTDNGNIYEPFIVFDFAGGNNSASLYLIDQNSFTQYTMQNIRCELIINYGSHLYAHCNLYATSVYNKTIVAIVGMDTDTKATLFVLKEDAYLTRTIDQTKSISNVTQVGGNYGADIYKANYIINGGCSLSTLSIDVSGFEIAVMNFPVPYCMDLTLENGTYNIDDGWMLYPGSRFEIGEDATLNLNGRLYALEGLYSTGMSGKYYPNARDLSNAGFTTDAVFEVNGKFNINSGATFGGIIQTTSTNADIKVDISATVINESFQVGGLATYDDNTNVMTFNGRVNFKGTVLDLVPGKRYVTDSTDSWTNESYTINKYVTSKTSTKPSGVEGVDYSIIPSNNTYAVYGGPKVVEVNQTMNGVFKYYEDIISGVTFVKRTYYSDTDETNSQITNLTQTTSSVSFEISSTEAGKMYKHLVEYKVEDGEYSILNPIEGVYTIENVTGKVTVRVTSGMKGDVDLDGYVTAADVTLIRRHLAGYTGLTNLKRLFLGDVDNDDYVTAADVTRIRRYLAGYIEIL